VIRSWSQLLEEWNRKIKEKIKRIIKDFLGEKYLIQHAETLKYDVGKAELARKRKAKSHEKIDATTDTVVESASVTPTCQTTVQAANTEHVKEAQAKGEQIIEVHDKPAACCHKAVHKERTIDSENITEEESGEMKEPEKVEELDDAPVVNVPHELIVEIIILIKKYSLESVKKSIDDAELYMLHGAIGQN
jgi:hypothetical protein